MYKIKIERASIVEMNWILILWQKFMQYLARKEPESFSLKDDYQQKYKETLPDLLVDPKTFVLLAKEGNTPIGYSFTSIRYPLPILEQKPFGQVSDLYVQEEYRGKGIGTAMVNHSTTWLRNKGVFELHLKTFVTNRKGISFWEKQGFSPVEVRLRRPL